MAKRFGWFMMCLVAVMLSLGSVAGCSKGMISVDAVDGLTTDVCDRHDKILRGELDPKDLNGDGKVDEKDDAKRATYLRSTELLRKVLSEARK